MNYKNKRVGSVRLSTESNPELMITSHVDSLGFATISFGNSMSVRVDCDGVDKLRNLASLTLDVMDEMYLYSLCEDDETEEITRDDTRCKESAGIINPFDWHFDSERKANV